jgi:phosphomannomutase
MKTHLIFDVDGTLTPSRQQINTTFASEFLAICCDCSVSLVSGSDYEKTCEQLTPSILQSTHYVFSAAGNQVRRAGQLIHNESWTPPQNILDYLSNLVVASKFSLRTGRHIETRPGSINFSIVGRNATLGERKLYAQWDMLCKEREQLAQQINNTFPEVEAYVGGEISIDISARGSNKSQVIKWFDAQDHLVFFGDRTAPGGNDHPLAQAIQARRGVVYTVKSWQQTRELLQILFNY